MIRSSLNNLSIDLYELFGLLFIVSILDLALLMLFGFVAIMVILISQLLNVTFHIYIAIIIWLVIKFALIFSFFKILSA